MPAMNVRALQGLGRRFLPSLGVAAALALAAAAARADDAVKLSITIKDQKFDPAELHAPPGKTIANPG